MSGYQDIINLLGGTVIAIGGWFARQLWDAMKELRRDLHKIEVALPRDYIRRDDLKDIRENLKDIREDLKGISSKLDTKADKP
jgi:hypothetical protein